MLTQSATQAGLREIFLTRGSGATIMAQAPTEVGLNEPFDVIYDCVNTGEPRELWGVLLKLGTVRGTFWADTVYDTKTVTNHFEGITEDLTLTIRVGVI